MILKNYWNFVAGSTNNKGEWDVQNTPYVRRDWNCIDPSGDPSMICVGGYTASDSLCQRRFGNWHLRPLSLLGADVGTGNTEPTINDYCLDSIVTSSFDDYKVNINVEAVGGSLHVILTVSGNNNTNSEITIREIGIYKKYSPDIYNESSPSRKLYYIRQLLETPVVVVPNDGFTRTFEWVQQ